MAQQENDGLPTGWKTELLGDAASIITKGTTPTTAGYQYFDEGIPFIKVENIIDNCVAINSVSQFISEDAHAALARSQFVEDDVLFSIAGTIGKTALVKKEYLPCNTNQAVAIIRGTNDLLVPDFLNYQLINFAQKIARENSRGGAMNNVSLGDLKNINAMVAPLPEQKRIVEKLDSLLAQVDTIQQRLDTLPDIIKRFRQSVLAAAVSGKLTKQWREENSVSSINELLNEVQKERTELKKAKKLKPSFGKYDEVESIFENSPNSWVWCCFDQISKNNNNALKAGPFGSALKKSDCTDSGYRVYGQEQVIAGDEKLVSYYIGDEKFEQLSACSVASGDILISLVGTIGKVLILSDVVEEGIINPRLVKLSLNSKVNRDFIKYYLDSIYAKEFFGQFSHGGTMDILNLGILKKLPISLPPVEEQTEIVRLVEQYFSLADTLEKNLANAKQRVDNLTQSILTKAFKGELVPQDPNDEPADKLLERIKAARIDAEKLEKAAKKAAKASKAKKK